MSLNILNVFVNNIANIGFIFPNNIIRIAQIICILRFMMTIKSNISHYTHVKRHARFHANILDHFIG